MSEDKPAECQHHWVSWPYKNHREDYCGLCGLARPPGRSYLVKEYINRLEGRNKELAAALRAIRRRVTPTGDPEVDADYDEREAVKAVALIVGEVTE